MVTDVHSDIRGSKVGGTVLFYPHGKGSTTASSWFLETARRGNVPAAIVTRSVDLSAVIGSVMARLIYAKEIPVMAGFTEDLYAELKPGTRVKVDGGTGVLELLG